LKISQQSTHIFHLFQLKHKIINNFNEKTALFWSYLDRQTELQAGRECLANTLDVPFPPKNVEHNSEIWRFQTTFWL
jgi:hypothetical protein